MEGESYTHRQREIWRERVIHLDERELCMEKVIHIERKREIWNLKVIHVGRKRLRSKELYTKTGKDLEGES